MCGIVGSLGDDALQPGSLEQMIGAIAHRGPDGTGQWTDPSRGIALGHARLAVIGRGDEGAQPMVSASGRYVLVYNGELYEHGGLRARLDGEGRAASWRGGSDTETLLACLEAWGLQRSLERAVGMFAVAVWDRERSELTLARDRLGEKPLHYGWCGRGRTLLFGSELGALRAHPAFDAELDPDALSLLLRFGQIPAPRTAFRGMHKLPPATSLTFDRDGRPTSSGPVPYWSLTDVALAGQHEPLDVGDEEAIDLFEVALTRAVKSQTLAEVPLGAFLSGGIDSSAVVALLQRSLSSPARTFTVGFEDATFDEAPHAAAVAAHLGTDHTEFRVTGTDALALVPALATVCSEPFADASMLPTLLLARLARSHVTVCLTGDGGDELLGGYDRYARARRVERLPAVARHVTGLGLLAIPARGWDALLTVTGRAGDGTDGLSGHRLRSLGRLLTRRTPFARYRDLASVAVLADRTVIGAAPASTLHADLRARWTELGALGALERMMAFDAISYLPDDILHKVDRAAMSVALETRIPLLDHRVVELAWRMPPRLRSSDRPSKWLLRALAARYVPAALLDRPKAGFAVPLASWLRGPLQGWTDDLLSGASVAHAGLLDIHRVNRLWHQHRSGARNRHNELWPVLMLLSWLGAQRGTPPRAVAP